MEVRAASPSDIEQLLRLEEASFATNRLSRRSFRRLLASPRAACLVAVSRGEVVGYAMILHRAGSTLARLYSIAVGAASRRAGAGRRLLDAAEAAARDRGCSALRLEVREADQGAVAFYEKAGYVRFGRHHDYYDDHGAALRFQKELGALSCVHVSGR